MQIELANRHRPFRHALEYLKQLQIEYSANHAISYDATAVCYRYLESLRTCVIEDINTWQKSSSQHDLHWIARALIASLLNEYNMLFDHIGQLLVLLDKNGSVESSQYPSVQKKIMLNINQLDDLVASTVCLEQRVVPALLEMSVVEGSNTLSSFGPTPTLH